MSIGFLVITDPNLLPKKPIPAVEYSTPALVAPDGIIGSTFTPTWIDDEVPSTRTYTIFLDGAQQGDSVGSGVRQWAELTGLAQGQHEIKLGYRDSPQATMLFVAITVSVTILQDTLELVFPQPSYTADSSSVTFTWKDDLRPDAAYDLHIYSDAARTVKVVGTDSVVFDTYYIGAVTSHTFNNDPSDGGQRYGKLIQFTSYDYSEFTGNEILFEYTAYTSPIVVPPPGTGGPNYDTIKEMADVEWATMSGKYTSTNMMSSDGYHAATIMMGAAQMYKTTGQNSYLNQGIRIAQNYIDSGVDRNSDGYLDWYATYEGYGDNGIIINHYHPEWRSAQGVADILIEMKRTGYTNGNASRIANWRDFLKIHVWNKWKPATGQTSDIPVSYLNTSSASSVGRIAVIAMALDKTDPTPGNNEYYTYITSATGPFPAFGKMFQTYVNLINAGNWQFPLYTTGDSLDRELDTQHSNDPIYAALRAKQLGYDPVGLMDEFLVAYEAHLDHGWFPTSSGFREYTNESGNINGWHNSSSHGHTLGAAISPELKARFLDMYLNHKPTFSFWSETGKNGMRAVWGASGLLWALNGGTL